VNSTCNISQCVILAGGLATRLGPITAQIPKALIPVNGRPFLEYQLSWLKKNEVRDVVLCVAHLGNLIREHVVARGNDGMKITIVDEGSNLRGTGGALAFAIQGGTVQEDFFLLYGDSFLPVDFQEVASSYFRFQARALMTVLRNRNRWDRSNARFEENKVFYDKKAVDKNFEFIDYGLTALNRDFIREHMPKSEKFDLADVFHQLSVEGSLFGFEETQKFYEIGSLTGLREFEKWAAANP
jgi:MurNAc alpha-1-phosphate uridylyltransferase